MTCYDSVNGLYKHFNLLPIQGAEAAAAAMVVKNPSLLLISCIHGTIGANAHLPQDLVCVCFFPDSKCFITLNNVPHYSMFFGHEDVLQKLQVLP